MALNVYAASTVPKSCRFLHALRPSVNKFLPASDSIVSLRSTARLPRSWCRQLHQFQSIRRGKSRLLRGSRMRCLLLFIAVLSVTFSLAQPSASAVRNDQYIMEIGRDNGGDLIKYARQVARLRNHQTQVRFKGRCASACTLYLSLRPSQTCIRKGASFLFHRAYGARRDMNQFGTEYMLSKYPVWVQRWIEAKGGLSNRFIRMNYAYASKYIKPCQSA